MRGIIRQQQPGFHEDLKAIADPQDQLAGLLEFTHRAGQMLPDLTPQDAAGPQVVPIAEPAGQAENLKIAHHQRRLQQPVDVQSLASRAGPLERLRPFPGRNSFRELEESARARLSHQSVSFSLDGF